MICEAYFSFNATHLNPLFKVWTPIQYRSLAVQ